jgi:hypothetical protein
MAITDVAQGLVALCREGKFEEATERYYADDIVSVEPFGEDPVAKGIAAVKAKGEWWVANHEVHGLEVGGPYINGDQFAVRFVIDVTEKASGKRSVFDEIGVYTVKNDKIAHEAFFYAGS